MQWKDHFKDLENMRDSTRAPQHSSHQRLANGGSLQHKLKELAGLGRNGDTQLAEIGPRAARMLDKLIHGGHRQINPNTGLREYMDHPSASPATPAPLPLLLSVGPSAHAPAAAAAAAPPSSAMTSGSSSSSSSLPPSARRRGRGRGSSAAHAAGAAVGAAPAAAFDPATPEERAEMDAMTPKQIADEIARVERELEKATAERNAIIEDAAGAGGPGAGRGRSTLAMAPPASASARDVGPGAGAVGRGRGRIKEPDSDTGSSSDEEINLRVGHPGKQRHTTSCVTRTIKNLAESLKTFPQHLSNKENVDRAMLEYVMEKSGEKGKYRTKKKFDEALDKALKRKGTNPDDFAPHFGFKLRQLPENPIKEGGVDVFPWPKYSNIREAVKHHPALLSLYLDHYRGKDRHHSVTVAGAHKTGKKKYLYINDPFNKADPPKTETVRFRSPKPTSEGSYSPGKIRLSSRREPYPVMQLHAPELLRGSGPGGGPAAAGVGAGSADVELGGLLTGTGAAAAAAGAGAGRGGGAGRGSR